MNRNASRIGKVESQRIQRRKVIESLFRSRWDGQHLSAPVVTLDQVSQALRDYLDSNAPSYPLSPKNVANFAKDLVRNVDTGNRTWPESVLSAGFTCRQVTGGGRCFEFIRVPDGQLTAFVRLPGPSDRTPKYEIASLSIPLASRRLGRPDEPWLIQVVVRLRVMEHHLAMVSGLDILELDHLQTNVKLGDAEVDALFLATDRSGKERYVTCEAKGDRDDILVPQILGQVKAACRSKNSPDEIIPTAIKVIGPSRIHLMQFQLVRREEAEALSGLAVENDAVYSFKPMVEGIGDRKRARVNAAVAGV